MPSSLTSPHFVTHREMNDLLGERTRQRWEKDGLLPEPDWIRVDRNRIGIYPELVLARLVVGNTRDPIEQDALRKTMGKCQRLVATDGYHRFKALLQTVFAELSDRQDWDFANFVSMLGEHDHHVIEAWHADVAEIEEELSNEAGLSFRSLVGTVCDAAPEGYITIAISGGGERRISDALSKLAPGASVVLERVGVESREREFVLPGLPVMGVEEIADDLRLMEGGDNVGQQQTDPFGHIVAREPFSAATFLGLPQNVTILSVRDEFERGHIPGLLPTEEDAPYVEAEQVFSFAFDSPLLDTHSLV